MRGHNSPFRKSPSLCRIGAECQAQLADLSGHSDAVGGALCVDDDALAERLRAQRTAIGGVPGALEVWLLLRSLRTLPLRLERHNTSARLIASWLQQSIGDVNHPLHGLVERVWHPSLPHHPGHHVAMRQMAPQQFGGVLSMELHSEGAAKALPQAVRRNATHMRDWRRICVSRRLSAIPPSLRRSLTSCGRCAATAFWRCDLSRGCRIVDRMATKIRRVNQSATAADVHRAGKSRRPPE